MRFYEVNPANTAQIAGPVPSGGRWVVPDDKSFGKNWNPAPRAPLPAEHFYEAIEDNRTPGPYESWGPSTPVGVPLLSFEGTLGAATARVRETLEIVQIPIDDLRARKQRELAAYIEDTRYANCETALHPTWVVRVERDDRAWFAEVNGVLQDRMRDRVYDADPKDYWPRDVPVRAINPTQNRYATFDVNESQWGQIMKDVGLHGYAIVDAANLVQTDIDNAVAADDWDALAAIDVTDALYGWPPVYRPDVEPSGNGR